ncbi:hypothetical protein HK099_001022 [Clydaea vesicula]|uniref:G-protein coupled receptors family 3 profile domain-containing protein n=1 Tax=Clydaea vesicula TaxID=447962 RepID=A0AAD5XV79_9FUNG|nr:hypothetical protein HK099_001022 [Clydaea vesicula]
MKGYDSGFDFIGGYDDELKMMSAIAQDYGAFMLNKTYILDPNSRKQRKFVPGYQSGLNTTAFRTAMNDTIHKLYVVDNSSRYWLNWKDKNMENYLSKPLNEYPEFPLNVGLGSYAPIQNFGMIISPPERLNSKYEKNEIFYGQTVDEDIEKSKLYLGHGLLPGKFAFLGGSGFSITSVSKNKELAFKFIYSAVDLNNPKKYINKFSGGSKSIPPYLPCWDWPEWNEDQQKAVKLALQSAVAPQYPSQSFPQFGTIEEKKLYRNFMVDVIKKNASVSLATEKLVYAINEVLKIKDNCPQGCDADKGDCQESGICICKIGFKNSDISAEWDFIHPENLVRNCTIIVEPITMKLSDSGVLGIILSALWTIYNPLIPMAVDYNGNQYLECISTSANVMTYLLIGFNCILIISCVVVAFLTRNVKSELKESREIGLSIIEKGNKKSKTKQEDDAIKKAELSNSSTASMNQPLRECYKFRILFKKDGFLTDFIPAYILLNLREELATVYIKNIDKVKVIQFCELKNITLLTSAKPHGPVHFILHFKLNNRKCSIISEKLTDLEKFCTFFVKDTHAVESRAVTELSSIGMDYSQQQQSKYVQPKAGGAR